MKWLEKLGVEIEKAVSFFQKKYSKISKRYFNKEEIKNLLCKRCGKKTPHKKEVLKGKNGEKEIWVCLECFNFRKR